MNQKINEIEVNGIVYVPKSEFIQTENKEGLDFVLVRTYSAGVHCGYLKERNGKEVVLLDSIRIWKWEGAASLSQLSMEGVKNAKGCKFGMPIKTELILTEAIEIHIMTKEAVKNIKNVPSWKL